MKQVLVDTNIWIEYFREGKFSQNIESLITEGRIATCGVVKAELFPFVKKKKTVVKALLNSIHHLSFGESWWDTLMEVHETILSKKYHPYGIADLILLTLCIKHNAGLLTQDKDFLRLESVIPVEIYYPYH